ncbi:hypothetical protein AB0L70_18465 [Kribbella sp. NPDC051952]|uniref:hypothetical protein n=1 Tax=Kribbella sp. NPDC051952 TaxID=3154851 RepID=UPI00342666C7
MTQYRLLLLPEVMQRLAALDRAASTQGPGGLRTREFQALKLGLRVLADGREEEFAGKRLRYRRHDLSDCAEIKLAVVPETRHNIDLGPSHRLIYREFESEDGGPPYRQVVAFAHRGADRPFEEAAAHLGREAGARLPTVRAATDSLTHLSSPVAPIRQPLPPDLRKALAAASDIAAASGATKSRPPAQQHRSAPGRSTSNTREL